MNLKQFSIIKMIILLFVGITILVGFLINNLYLAIFSLLTGIMFIFVVRKKFKKVIIDERVENISKSAARQAQTFTILVLFIFSVFFIFTGQQHEDIYVESLGVTLGYLAMFNVALYAIFFHYFNKKYGGDK